MRVESKTKNLSPFEYQKMRTTMTQTQIADFLGITLSALWKWGKRHNVILARVADYEIAEAITTKTPKCIAAEYNISLGAVYYRLSKMGICTKHIGQR